MNFMNKINQIFKNYWLTILLSIGILSLTIILINKNKEINSLENEVSNLENNISTLESEKEDLEVQLEECESEKTSYNIESSYKYGDNWNSKSDVNDSYE